jgi:hypothetical protein
VPPNRYDSEALFAQVQSEARRPTSDALLRPELIWEALSQAQEHWFTIIANHVPQILYGPSVQLTTADGGLTYTFGVDVDGDPIMPVGEVEIREGVRGRVLRPATQWNSGATFVMEGNKIRWPDGRSRIPAGGFWARFASPPLQGIDADTQPVLPKIVRKLLPLRALEELAGGVLRRDPQPYAERQAKIWSGDGDLGQQGLLTQLKQQFYGQGTEGISGGGRWQDSIDTGEGYTRHY